ncbi:DMT family transporter [Lactiplantibacillus plantarum]|nr:DMT family transporter [Lactiplantibacillus plantarum]
MLVAILGIFIGIGLPIQTAVNIKLKTAAKSPFISSFLSFTIGGIALLLITNITRPKINSVIITQQPWWLWIGGLLGALFLTSNILLLPKIGSFQTVLMPIIGQIIMSIVIDNWGLFDSRRIPFNFFGIVGVTIVLIGAGVTIYPGNQHYAHVAKRKENYIFKIIGIITGMFSAIQTAINGHLGIVYGSSLFAATLSFIVGWICLLGIVIITDRTTILVLQLSNFRQLPMWSWLGGLIGASFVLGNVVMMPILGAGLSTTIILGGQLLGSVCLSYLGWFDIQKTAITRAEIIGIILIVLGILIIKLF